MAFRVGQKVVCIDGNIKGRNINCVFPPNVPVEGVVYTIRDFVEARGKNFLRLVEIRNPPQPFPGDGGPLEAAFAIDRFRPIVERKTDISVSKAMLNPSLEDVANLILQEVTLCP